MHNRHVQVGVSLKAHLHDLSRLHLSAGVRELLIEIRIGIACGLSTLRYQG